jgi:hypothetical protein
VEPRRLTIYGLLRPATDKPHRPVLPVAIGHRNTNGFTLRATETAAVDCSGLQWSHISCPEDLDCLFTDPAQTHRPTDPQTPPYNRNTSRVGLISDREFSGTVPRSISVLPSPAEVRDGSRRCDTVQTGCVAESQCSHHLQRCGMGHVAVTPYRLAVSQPLSAPVTCRGARWATSLTLYRLAVSQHSSMPPPQV